MERCPALDLVSTIRHDGEGGVADDLATVEETTRWVRGQDALLTGSLSAGDFAADEELRSEIVALRQAVRALFAQAVSPAPPSRADAHRLIPTDQALARLNSAAAREPVAPQLDWRHGEAPAALVLSTELDSRVRLIAGLARSAIDFLTGPQRDQLRACAAPRCVRYFVKGHGRQEWCKPACGNRARVARHYQRRRGSADVEAG
ncbi:ABATE domain-containing protein [Streptomyces sp. H10-C2]|uniref:CGNR zinc finger domain-containing protein n=1 Tax=unclassified Streptomyces TaxID=2593676 RepID=UPI0024BB184F|nr:MULTISPECIES: ABATE domain-containing protein [unclassified Streptomyces]MDJ0343121.1 ABATE domain-containing protein [Streptomyces sp. PH10-H1]MDJ0371063.1 ABATE domain-containing protein [Streptomyces sp. H10-C2]